MNRKSEFLLLRMAILLLLVLFSLKWDASASSGCSRKTPDSTPDASELVSLRLNAFNSEGLLEPATIFADLDGDHHRDLVAAQVAGDQYKVVIALSSRPHLKVLIPPVQLGGGFKVSVVDVNKDGYQDIVVTTPALLQPMAVWLGNGKGDFEAADQVFFKNDFGLTQSAGYRSYPIWFSQDFLLNPAHPVCEKMSPAFVHAGQEPNGFIDEHWGSGALLNEYPCITPRSPPFVISSI